MAFITTSQKLSNRIGRVISTNRTTAPFLSGDVFARNSDFEIPNAFSLSNKLLQKVKASKVIFCDGYQVQKFLEDMGHELADKILIVGNSDKDWLEFPFENAPRVKAVFLQNSFVQDERVVTLPIGVENLTYYRNGRARNFDTKLIQIKKQDKVLVGPFSPTHQIRQNLVEDLKSCSRVEVTSSFFLDPFSYAKYAAQFAYIASPRGNGEDTHRTWESLYRGTSPVLLKNAWSLSLQMLKIPISLVETWDSLNIGNLPPFEEFNPAKLDALWWPYWRNRIVNLL